MADNLYNSSDEALHRIELICGQRPPLYNLNVTDEAAFDRVFAEHPDIDNVIHFAALKVRDFSNISVSALHCNIRKQSFFY